MHLPRSRVAVFAGAVPVGRPSSHLPSFRSSSVVLHASWLGDTGRYRIIGKEIRHQKQWAGWAVPLGSLQPVGGFQSRVVAGRAAA